MNSERLRGFCMSDNQNNARISINATTFSLITENRIR